MEVSLTLEFLLNTVFLLNFQNFVVWSDMNVTQHNFDTKLFLTPPHYFVEILKAEAKKNQVELALKFKFGMS